MGRSCSPDLRVYAEIEHERTARPTGGGKLAAHAAFLIAWVEKQSDATMPELAAKA